MARTYKALADAGDLPAKQLDGLQVSDALGYMRALRVAKQAQLDAATATQAIIETVAASAELDPDTP